MRQNGQTRTGFLAGGAVALLVGLTAATSIGTAENKEQKLFEVLPAQNNVPIAFYGKIEDQFSNSLAGVEINFGVRVYNGRESTVHRGQVLSDDQGRFTISGCKGESLSFIPVKPGYALASLNTGAFTRN